MGRHWTPRDDAALRRDIGVESGSVIAARLRRTLMAVSQRAGDLGLSFYREATAMVGLGLTEAAALLGVGAWQVRYWQRREWLRVRRVPSYQSHATAIEVADLDEFLRTVGGLLHLAPPDPTWREVYAEARADLLARHIHAQELAALLGYTHRSVLRRLERRAAFPPPAVDLGSRNGGHWYERAAVAAWLDSHPEYWTRAARAALRGEGR